MYKTYVNDSAFIYINEKAIDHIASAHIPDFQHGYSD